MLKSQADMTDAEGAFEIVDVRPGKGVADPAVMCHEVDLIIKGRYTSVLLSAVLEKIDALVDFMNTFAGGIEAEQSAVVLDRFHGCTFQCFFNGKT